MDDPLRWLWSTLRDVVGATVEPWCSLANLAAVLGKPVSGFDRWCLRWVSEGVTGIRDPGVFPRPAPERDVPMAGLDDLLMAAEAATRSHGRDARRKRLVRWLFIALARHQGWREVAALARVAGVLPKSIYRIGLTVPPRAVDAASLCLGDERLLRSMPAPVRAE